MPSVGDVPDCGQELLHAGYFLKVARRAGGDRLDHRVLLRGGRQHDHPGVGQRLDDLPARLDAVLVRHHDVQHDNIGRQLGSGPHRRLTVPGLPDHLELSRLLQHHPQAVPHDRVVVGEKDPYGTGL